MSLTLTPITGIPLIHKGDALAQILLEACKKNNLQLQSGDIFVLAQKIVSKAEGRLVNLSTVTPSPEAVCTAAVCEKDPRLVELILQESRQVLRLRPGTIIVQHKIGFVCANAGIDHSNVKGEWGNADDWVLLLPEDADASACSILSQLEIESETTLGVLIIDSHGRAWRNGTLGTAIGMAGIPGLVDLRGKPDLYGYQLRITQVGAADELAAAASLVMGQADEAVPAVHVRGFPYPLRNGSVQEMIRPAESDLFH